MKSYDQAPPEVHERVATLIRRFYPDLDRVGVRIDLLMASTDAEDGHAVTHQGYPALAVVKILDLKNRTMDRGDAEIVIDRDAYDGMADEERDALLDHELYHLLTVNDKFGRPKMDDHDRPKLKMRKHDFQVGWFHEIARRHQINSQEVQQAQAFVGEQGQLYFGTEGFTPFVKNLRGSESSVTIRNAGTGEGIKIDKDGIHQVKAA